MPLRHHLAIVAPIVIAGLTRNLVRGHSNRLRVVPAMTMGSMTMGADNDKFVTLHIIFQKLGQIIWAKQKPR